MFYYSLLDVLIEKLYEMVLSLKRFKIVRMCYILSPNKKNGGQMNERYCGKIEIIYDNLVLIECLMDVFTNDIGSVILGYSLEKCYEPNYLDGPDLALTCDL